MPSPRAGPPVSDRAGRASRRRSPAGAAAPLRGALGLAIALALAGLAAAELDAQAVLTGTVVSAGDGEPVEGASVTLETWDGSPVAEARTDEAGRFRLEVERPQAYLVSAAAREFSRSELELVELARGQVTDVTLTVTRQERPEPRPRYDAVEAAAGEIAGRVIDQGTGTAVPGATVALLPREGEERLVTVTTGPEGIFRLRVPDVGIYRLFAEVGTFARSATLLVDGSMQRGLSLTVELVSDPVQLDELIAEGRQDIYWWQDQRPMEVWPYWERRYFYGRLNMGRFYDGEYLQQMRGMSAYEFMRTHTFPTTGSGRCNAVEVNLDGHHVGIYYMGLEGMPRRQQPDGAYEENLLVLERIGYLSAQDLEGVEVYREGSFNPRDLSMTPRVRPRPAMADVCEKIGIWRSRDPG